FGVDSRAIKEPIDAFFVRAEYVSTVDQCNRLRHGLKIHRPVERGIPSPYNEKALVLKQRLVPDEVVHAQPFELLNTRRLQPFRSKGSRSRADDYRSGVMGLLIGF